MLPHELEVETWSTEQEDRGVVFGGFFGGQYITQEQHTVNTILGSHLLLRFDGCQHFSLEGVGGGQTDVQDEKFTEEVDWPAANVYIQDTR